MLQCTDIKKQPTANIIDGNVQLHILSLIPDNFQGAVILLPAHPASFAHNFVSGMQSFNFSESQDAIVLQTSH